METLKRKHLPTQLVASNGENSKKILIDGIRVKMIGVHIEKALLAKILLLPTFYSYGQMPHLLFWQLDL